MILFIEGRRDAYGTDQIRKTMTVGELKNWLEEYDDEMPVMLRNDGGYTYGSITRSSFEEGEEAE